MIKGHTSSGREYHVSGEPVNPDKCYPRQGHHIWNEFAGLAIEMGGYSDLTAVDPYTGRRFWLEHAFWCDEHAAAVAAAEPGDAAVAVYVAVQSCDGCHGSVIVAIRRLLDAMEQAGFPDNYREDPKGRDR